MRKSLSGRIAVEDPLPCLRRVSMKRDQRAKEGRASKEARLFSKRSGHLPMIEHAGAIEIKTLLFLVVLCPAVRIPFDGSDIAIMQCRIAGRFRRSRRHQCKTDQYQAARLHGGISCRGCILPWMLRPGHFYAIRGDGWPHHRFIKSKPSRRPIENSLRGKHRSNHCDKKCSHDELCWQPAGEAFSARI
jgi:hypothetical protein